ncbi:unnamed protein product [Soboliphyme baturini]|uniref:Uncharacterized protein n=1 Tax=Soboliphyme baturini TaxID=241478 RepID=A0A183IKB4_9BILA|nr:unnamed protein product [Soboliphyme baturini]
MTTDVEAEWQLFKRGLLEAAAECYGYKRVGLPPGGQKRSAWWTRKIQLAVKEKKAAFKKSLRSKVSSNCMRYVEARVVLEWNFLTANKVFRRTIFRLRGGKKGSLRDLKDKSGNPLTKDEDSLRRWTKYFEEPFIHAQPQKDSHEEQQRTNICLCSAKYEKLNPARMPSERRQSFQMSHATPLSKQVSSDCESMASYMTGPDDDNASSTPPVILSLLNSDTDAPVTYKGGVPQDDDNDSNKLVSFLPPLPAPPPTLPTPSKAKLYLKPPSLHISIEIDGEQRQYRNQELSTSLQVSRSLANFVDCYHPVNRASLLRNHQLEIADISAEYMRLNGVTPQFKVRLLLQQTNRI